MLQLVIQMKPFKLYFAGDWSGVETSDRTKITCEVTNRLVTFAYPKLFENWLSVAKNDKGNIILDSGAFSAWNKGSKIDIKKYIEYCLIAQIRAEEEGKKIYVVNLDVIPGKVGTTKNLQQFTNKNNKKEIDRAAKEGFMNMKKMVENKIQPIHVFHQGEGWKWLDRMLKYINYIGISPANDMSINSKRKWIYSVFSYLHKNNIKVKTHGFAVASSDVLQEFPWSSCDAASWRLSAAMGSIYYPNKGFSSSDYTKMSVIYISNTKGNNISKYLIKLLKKDGYSIDSLQTFGARAMFNIRYFLGLEKCINEKKKTIDFIPRNTLNLQL